MKNVLDVEYSSNGMGYMKITITTTTIIIMIMIIIFIEKYV